MATRLKARVLLAEDDSAQREILQELLELEERRPGEVLDGDFIRERVLPRTSNNVALGLMGNPQTAHASSALGLTGRGGGRLAGVCDELLAIPSDATERIQEGHITVIHLLCELVNESGLVGSLLVRSGGLPSGASPP